MLEHVGYKHRVLEHVVRHRSTACWSTWATILHKHRSRSCQPQQKPSPAYNPTGWWVCAHRMCVCMRGAPAPPNSLHGHAGVASSSHSHGPAPHSPMSSSLMGVPARRAASSSCLLKLTSRLKTATWDSRRRRAGGAGCDVSIVA